LSVEKKAESEVKVQNEEAQLKRNKVKRGGKRAKGKIIPSYLKPAVQQQLEIPNVEEQKANDADMIVDVKDDIKDPI